MKLVVAITGASGVIYSKRLLEILGKMKIETHLVISPTAKSVIEHELEVEKQNIENLASYVYEIKDWNSPIASGSFKTNGLIIMPCSMKTLAGIANGYSDNLILRAADVTMKEKRRLILVPRETPFNVVHLQNMLNLAQQGVCIVPMIPAYYHKPKTINDLVDFMIGKILDLLDIEHSLYLGWKEAQ